MDRSYYASVESGKRNISINNIEKIANGLNITLEELFKGLQEESMGKKALSSRNNWQTQSGPGGLAGTAEKNLYIVFQRAFKGTIYEIKHHPDHFKHLYENFILSPKKLDQI